jgi:ATP synthase F1 gamma subunit
MSFISQVKKDIEFYKSLSSLLKVLKGIAISQFHAFEKKVGFFGKFSQIVDGFLEGINLEGISHPFIKPINDILGVVAVTTDTGLLGGLNMQVINVSLRELSQREGKLIVIGERGRIYAKEFGVNCVYMEGIKENYIFAQAIALRNYIVEEIGKGNLGEVMIIYPYAHSLVVQKIYKKRLLPYQGEKKEVYLDLSDFILESHIERIVEYLVYLWMGKILYEIFSMAKLAEYAARFMHLEDCTHKLEDLDQKLKFKYFKLRHELTDRGMRELFAARKIYAKQ